VISRAVTAVIVALAATGCGGDDFDPPACEDGEAVVILRTADEIHESASTIVQHVFVNKLTPDEPGILDLTLAGGGEVHLEWDELVANGGSVDARGSVDLSGGTSHGTCAGDGFPGTLRMDDDGDGGAFQLRRLRPQGDCAAPVIDGDLVGCWRFQPF
jgi:hypothetical protein